MDNPGWSAGRRAQRESEYYVPHRGADGNFLPVEVATPIDENFIGGFHPHLRPATPGPPPPPKDVIYSQGYQFGQTTKSSINSSHLTTMSAVERSQALRIPRMEPHLQFMVGPLLRYDTVEDGVWYGAVMIVTSDAGSVYEPHPMLSFEWDPDVRAKVRPRTHSAKLPSFDLGPHPADPNTTFTFWRFALEIPLGPTGMEITYSINNGQPLAFHVPALTQNMRWATYSCNGFSAGVNPDDFRGPGYNSGYDPVWVDLLSKHAEEPFHVLVGGGDQIYCDGITREPELQEWIGSKPHERKQYQLTDEISSAIDRFYFNHYCVRWRSGAFARANSTIPMLNMAEHYPLTHRFDPVTKLHPSNPPTKDLIDGFGSYPDDLQMSPIFRAIGSRGYFFFLLFQCFINDDIDGVDDRPGKHLNRSIVIGASNGPYVPFPSHSFLAYMGPNAVILLLDCRAERKKDQVCSQSEYQKVFERLSKLPSNVKHLCVQIGIPIAYPRLVFLEAALESKFNPLVALGRSGSLGLSSFVNKFNAEAELLDDLNDHWTSRSHKKERNWFIQQLQKFAKIHRIRVTFLSGDVHCAAVGVFKTLRVAKKPEIPPPEDHRYMVNIVTSAIVNTPPPNAVISMVSSLASKNHKTMHQSETDETMLPVFATETNDKPRKQKFIMGQRNWCSVNYSRNDEWVFDIRVEREKGMGETVGYSVRTPPPGWTSS
ncbi:hypothetical protein C8R45DRAFT_1187359 [Mycena sanguinolenta]|nr:hypothetical protein C8R45DRAFT_1187359 [Mycena sanguinolenta]